MHQGSKGGREAFTMRLLRKFTTDGKSEREALHGIVLRLVEIATRISSEKDIDALLDRIVTEARELTCADGGSLYVVDGEELIFKVLQNQTLSARGSLPKLGEFRFRVDGRSLAGLAASERRSLNIPDVRETEHHSPEVDARYQYTTRSMLVVPMRNLHGDIIGVLQLINAMTPEGEIDEFDEAWVPYIEALASLAAVAMENTRLLAEMSKLFESLVRYSVRAIDARDPCTAGHSSRVASYATKLAREFGGFDARGLKEIRLAGLLHDIGKIGVREHILTKALKIPADRMSAVRERFESASRAFEIDERRAGGDDVEGRISAMRVRVQADLDYIEGLQIPRWLSEGDLARIQRIAEITFVDSRGSERRLLEDDEAEALKIVRGNLTPDERRDMEQHALHTHTLLKQLPFPVELANVPDYASLHHEKLNGSGYPFGLSAEGIPLGSRIMAIADIYDSLLAEDRPYKPPMPEPKAMGIIRDMVDQGELDPEVFAVLERLVESDGIGPRRRASARGVLDKDTGSWETTIMEADPPPDEAPTAEADA